MRALKILIVDDDLDNAKSLGELFEFEGHKAHVVTSGAQAINCYLGEDFDIGFVDVMMPGMNGIESFMQIRKLKPKAKVFMMSGYSIEDVLKQAVTHGTMVLLSQELNDNTLCEVINDHSLNDMVVTPFLAKQQIEFMRDSAHKRGLVCQIADSPAAVERGAVESDLLILNMNLTVIDALGVYSTLRKAQDMPSTVLVAPQSDQIQALRDMYVTGILNKPFDLDIVLSCMTRIAA